MTVPSPPKVHAPHRVSAYGSSDSAVSQPPPSGTGANGVPASAQGAQVLASVGVAPSPPAAGTPSGPATSTPTVSSPVAGAPGGDLARTGSDVGLVLTFALLAVLLGVLLVRLGSHRPRTSPTTS